MARVATLGQLHRPPGWVWVHCARCVPLCQHHAPMALAPLIIRWDRTRRVISSGSALAVRRAATRARRCSIQGGSRTAWAGNRSRLRTMRQ
jgi:hypothetical protein